MPTLFASRTIDDPRDLKVIRALQAVGAGRSTVQLPAMSSSFRDELRAQLVAVTPRLVAEGVRPGTETASRPEAAKARRTVASKTASRAAARPRTRPMTVLVAGAAVVVLGLGGATWLARNALPGDALYGLKRTAEGVDLSFSNSDLDKGHALLVGAQTRVAEVDQLITRPQSMALAAAGTSSAAGALSDSTVKLVVSTLATADTATQQGVTLIGDDAVKTGNQAGLTLVSGWAGGSDGKGGQIGRIQSLVDRIPSTAAHDAAEASLANIDAAYARAGALLADLQAGRTCTRDRDAFGPKPCAAVTPPAVPSVTPSAPSTGTTDVTPGSTAPSTTPATGGASGPAPSTPSATPSPSRTRTQGAGPDASTSPTPILTVGSCGVVVAGISLGPCTPSR